MNAELPEYLKDHDLRAPQLQFDLAEEVAKLGPIPEGENSRGVALLNEHGLRVVLSLLRGDTTFGQHAPTVPVTMQVIRGAIRIQSGDRVIELHDNQMVALDANVPRTVGVLEDSAVLTTTSV